MKARRGITTEVHDRFAGTRTQCTIVDIKRTGCLLDGPARPSGNVTVTFRYASGSEVYHVVVDRVGTIEDMRANDPALEPLVPVPGAPSPPQTFRYRIAFRKPLTTGQRDFLTRGPKKRRVSTDGQRENKGHLLRQAESDQTEVQEELREIQACRSHVFLGTIAALGATALATLTALSQLSAGRNELTMLSASPWILAGALIGTTLLTIGITASLEKARAIHLRRGFLGALGYYLRRGFAPPAYRGWASLRMCHLACRAREKQRACLRHRRHQERAEAFARGCCPAHAGPCDEPPKWQRCWDEGIRDAVLLKGKRLLPATLDSFMSLSGMLYSVSYFMAAVTAVVSLILWVCSTWACWKGIWWAMLLAPIIGILCGIAFGYVGEKCRGRRYVRWMLAVIAALQIFYLLLGAIFNACKLRPGLVGVFMVGVTASCMAWLGAWFIYELRRVRRGRYSSESMRASWHRVFVECHEV